MQHRGYDVFGRPRDIAAGNNLLASWQGVTKGYTDHEHLNEQQLIHMNGRIYDFNVGRFLSVDPFLQFPENSQSANPYSYILNNPMSGIDPTGYSAVGDNHQEEMTKVNEGEAVVENNKTTNGEKNVNRAVRDNRSANKVGTFSASRASTFGGSGNNDSASSGTSGVETDNLEVTGGDSSKITTKTESKKVKTLRSADGENEEDFLARLSSEIYVGLPNERRALCEYMYFGRPVFRRNFY
ncbi:RHS repeat domain-containing protein [Shewanella colwelliana]|uniref:RHS repeat domain-containing protein n=1 Tax=Shewanella colwelliana TaxID=23 RepID=UPI00048E9E94|nr:RHS repeat-associated core domain-containing protein [Shewanella colwelliana]